MVLILASHTKMGVAHFSMLIQILCIFRKNQGAALIFHEAEGLRPSAEYIPTRCTCHPPGGGMAGTTRRAGLRPARLRSRLKKGYALFKAPELCRASPCTTTYVVAPTLRVGAPELKKTRA